MGNRVIERAREGENERERVSERERERVRKRVGDRGQKGYRTSSTLCPACFDPSGKRMG